MTLPLRRGSFFCCCQGRSTGAGPGSLVSCLQCPPLAARDRDRCGRVACFLHRVHFIASSLQALNLLYTTVLVVILYALPYGRPTPTRSLVVPASGVWDQIMRIDLTVVSLSWRLALTPLAFVSSGTGAESRSGIQS
ncbi:hypothetical protein EXIGLDRAFT_345754 [Exidia glandulosa HHB12029]|uniref:Uncharacterized protein n=1 Tax=Exidia glandulosa HHB12029 TaxID=1314781 RepID=A0A165CGV3_EXIGL|nr:hypothetical protein EXIGLDRAFT_345754 [Exidia glandulosa HHB12029]